MATTGVKPSSEHATSGDSMEIKAPVILELGVIDSDEETKQRVNSPPSIADSEMTNADAVTQHSEPGKLAKDPTTLPEPLSAASTDLPATVEVNPTIVEPAQSLDAEEYPSSVSDISLPPTPAVQLSESSATLGTDKQFPFSERPSEKLALQILDIIQKYGLNTRTGGSADWPGRAKFLPVVERCVLSNEPIKMVLPAFPCKSINRVDKVLGTLPDFGEELALTHLNGLCESIADIYEPGGEVVITSDGLVYNDILGIPDADVWEYSTAIRDIIQVRELRFIKTLRIIDLLDHVRTAELTRDEYLTHAGCYRRELTAKFAPKDLDLRGAILNEPDTCMTYKGYAKFLHKDLRHSSLAKDEFGRKKLSGEGYRVAVKKVAMAMIERGKTFAAAIQVKCPDYVRLSIHPSIGQTKLSVPLIPQAGNSTLMTPWHSAIAIGTDGSFRAVHAADVRETHDVIFRNGRPHHLREKSDLWDFGLVRVEFEHLYPCGLIIRPAAEAYRNSPPSLSDVDTFKVRKLAELQSPVVLRGFANTNDRELYIKKANEMGTILPWMYGQVMVVKDKGQVDRGSNNVASNEAMPMHYDGIFKWGDAVKDEQGNDLKDERGNDIKIQIPPRFQMFSCKATAPKGSGYTLFAESRLFFQHLPAPYTIERLQNVKWRLHSVGYWHSKIELMDLVAPHPVTGVPTLRWHESWPGSKTKYSTCEVAVENDTQDIVQMVDKLMYDRRVCLRFSWEQGDILLADNSSMMHTRSQFVGNCERELWRIHLDQMEIPQHVSQYTEAKAQIVVNKPEASPQVEVKA